MAVGPRGHQLISKEGPAVREAENQFQKEIDLTEFDWHIIHDCIFLRQLVSECILRAKSILLCGF